MIKIIATYPDSDTHEFKVSYIPGNSFRHPSTGIRAARLDVYAMIEYNDYNILVNALHPTANGTVVIRSSHE